MVLFTDISPDPAESSTRSVPRPHPPLPEISRAVGETNPDTGPNVVRTEINKWEKNVTFYHLT